MRLILTSLLSFSSVGAGLFPTIQNFNNSSHTVMNDIGPQNSRNINYNKECKIETNDDSRGWKFLFNWDWSNWLPKKVELPGEGIKMHIIWGNETRDYSLKSFEIIPGDDQKTAFFEDWKSAAAGQQTKISYMFRQTTEDGFNTEFNINFTTYTYWSITGSSGTATFKANFAFTD